jgi:hypothetical protein
MSTTMSSSLVSQPRAVADVIVTAARASSR